MSESIAAPEANSRAECDRRPGNLRDRLGLPLIAILGLALIAAPRVVLHDLGIIHERTGLNALFVFVPLAIWVVTVLIARVPHPLITLLAVGLVYGVFLAIGHQSLWHIAFAENPPRLGGNLAGLDPAVQAAILRSFSVVSSIVTGAVAGAITGAVAWGIKLVSRR